MIRRRPRPRLRVTPSGSNQPSAASGESVAGSAVASVKSSAVRSSAGAAVGGEADDSPPALGGVGSKLPTNMMFA